MIPHPRRLLAATALLLALLAGVPACAHRREIYYPPQDGIQVRAPFVDVRVPSNSRRAAAQVPRRRNPRIEPALELDDDDWTPESTRQAEREPRSRDELRD